MSSISPDQLAGRLGSILGADRVREPRGREAAAANVVVEPIDIGEIVEVVRACETDHIALAPIAAGRTLSEIRRTPVALGVSLARMRQVIAYEPADMTITVEAGLALGDLNRTIASSHQRLPMDPCDPDSTTVGSLIAASHAGPLRLSEGTVRDLLIGIRYVGNGGRAIHGGGRVVKNVAGYDLMKVMGGSFGTLGIVTEATFKVRPIPQEYAIAMMDYDKAALAFEAGVRLHDSIPLAHLEVLSPAASRACTLAEKFILIAAISGSRSEVNSMRDSIGRIVPGVMFLEEGDASATYTCVRDLDLSDQPLVAQVALPPSEILPILMAASAEFVAHAECGIAKLFVSEDVDLPATVNRWREIAHRVRGHLRILHCDTSVRSLVDYFDVPNEGAMRLMLRLKSAFDPSGIFNPGCFVGGI